MPTVCIGLLDERGNTAPCTSPTDATSRPDASSTATEPRWKPSTKPDRTTSASTSPPAYVTSALDAEQVARLPGGQRRPVGELGERLRPRHELSVRLDRHA